MKIVHICLSCFYLDDQSYQENELVKYHVQQGHEVLVLASTDARSLLGKIEHYEPGAYIGNDGANVIRIEYRKIFPKFLACKIRAHPNVYAKLHAFKPEAILFHGTCGYELVTVARYVRKNPEVIFYIDSHEDTNNSARTFISREILHKLFYRFCLSQAWPIARKVLAVSTEAMEFVHKMYKVPIERIELFPLGGSILEDAQYNTTRAQGRKRYGLEDNQIMFVQAGKQTAAKRLIETLRSFAAAPSHAKLFIAGSIDPAIKGEAMELIAANPNIHFLGWQSPEAIKELLCAADVYLQPGTQSVTMQNSLCCRCVPIIADVPAHQIYVDKNGWLVKDEMGLESAIQAVCAADLSVMARLSHGVALRLLDYAQLSQRVLR